MSKLKILKEKDQKAKNNLIIFIHGYTAGESTWIYKNGKRPFIDAIFNEQEIEDNFDIGLYIYQTDLIPKSALRNKVNYYQGKKTTRNHTIEELGNLLATEINNRCQQYTGLVLIGHSMGGVIAKRFLINDLNKKISDSKVKLYISLATPHSGSDLAKLAAKLNPQAKDLIPASETIDTLNREWVQCDLPKRRFFVAYNDLVVKGNKAIPIDIDPDVEYTSHDHSSIVAPDDEEDIVVVAIRNLLKEVFQKEKKKINEDWKWFADENGELVVEGLPAIKYRDKIKENFDSIRVFGMSEEVPLENLFVRVNILEKIQEKYRDSIESLEKNYNREERRIIYGRPRETKTGIETINSIEKMIVLGKPGAGKSTYLKFLALQSITPKLELTNPKIPIFITLKELADKNVPLIQFIESQFDKLKLKDKSIFVETLLENGECLVLLDGLDEVQEKRKEEVIKDIIDLSTNYNQNQFVVSCRVAAYNHWFTKFTDVEMADFNDRQIEEFIKNWFSKEPEVGDECWSKLKEEVSLKELASTPLLLTLLCIAYDESFDFHTNRAELYREATNALLKKWDTTRRIKRFEPYKELSLARKESLLSRIAAETFSKGKYFVKRQELIKLIAKYIKNILKFDHEEIKEVAENILDAIIANHGIIIPRAKGIYSFAHLTFQEYFTARYIVNNSGKGATDGVLKEQLIG